MYKKGGNMNIGYQIRHLREVKAISVKQLAKDLSVSETTIHNWESGKRKPKKDNIQAMARIFKVKVEELTQYL